MEWLIIETAPKDGTEILVFPDVTVTYWGFTKNSSNPYGWLGKYCFTVDEYDTINPTHWMPLPEPPTFKDYK